MIVAVYRICSFCETVYSFGDFMFSGFINPVLFSSLWEINPVRSFAFLTTGSYSMVDKEQVNAF